jgi:hypothetical protein
MGWVVNVTPRPLFLREGDPVPIVQEMEPMAGLDKCARSPPHWDSIPGLHEGNIKMNRTLIAGTVANEEIIFIRHHALSPKKLNGFLSSLVLNFYI